MSIRTTKSLPAIMKYRMTDFSCKATLYKLTNPPRIPGISHNESCWSIERILNKHQTKTCLMRTVARQAPRSNHGKCIKSLPITTKRWSTFCGAQRCRLHPFGSRRRTSQFGDKRRGWTLHVWWEKSYHRTSEVVVICRVGSSWHMSNCLQWHSDNVQHLQLIDVCRRLYPYCIYCYAIIERNKEK